MSGSINSKIQGLIRVNHYTFNTTIIYPHFFTDALCQFQNITVWSDGGSKHFKNSTIIFNYIKLKANFQVFVEGITGY